VINHLIARGYPVYPGAMGENITTAGIDVQALRLGDRLRAGAALIEITQPRGPCSALNIFGRSIKAEIYDDQVRGRDSASLRWGMSGFYASVIEEGEVRSGDAVELLGETG
jgi:MOSC domain-containing protein YiiM